MKLNRDQSVLNSHLPPSLMICGRESYINVISIDSENPRSGPYFGTQTDLISLEYLPSQHLKCVDSHKEWRLGWLFISTVTFTFLGSDPVLRGGWMRPWISIGWHWTDAACVWWDKTSSTEQWMSLAVTLLSSPDMAVHAVYFHVLRFLCIFCNTGMCWI